MENKLIQRIISKGFDLDNLFYEDKIEHIFEFTDGTSINVSKMSAIDIARHAFNNKDDGLRILNYIKDSQKVESYATLLSISLMLGLDDYNNSKNRKIMFILEKISKKDLINDLIKESNKKSKQENQKISFMDVLVEKVEIELKNAIL